MVRTSVFSASSGEKKVYIYTQVKYSNDNYFKIIFFIP